MRAKRVAAIALGGVTAFVVAAAATWIMTRPNECPSSGCSSSVRIDLTTLAPAVREAAATAEVCVEGACSVVVLAPNRPDVIVHHDGRTVGSGSITLEDRDGVVLQRLELAHEVEGTETRTFDDCLPTCWMVSLAARDGSLEER